MSEKKLNVAVIGCGAISKLHMEGVLEKKCNLYAICDNATDDRMEEKRKAYNPEVATTDYKELVADPKVDAVIITMHLRMRRN